LISYEKLGKWFTNRGFIFVENDVSFTMDLTTIKKNNYLQFNMMIDEVEKKVNEYVILNKSILNDALRIYISTSIRWNIRELKDNYEFTYMDSVLMKEPHNKESYTISIFDDIEYMLLKYKKYNVSNSSIKDTIYFLKIIDDSVVKDIYKAIKNEL
jgi:hypothetical protein